MPVMEIILLSLIALVAALGILRFLRSQLRAKTMALLLGGAIILTSLSLLFHTEGHSGTLWRIQYGWPHTFFTTIQTNEGGDTISHSFVFGFLGSYVLSNLFFYFSMLLLLSGIVSILKKPRALPD
jgi:hypothetical protein